jgi:hypothetical protein
MYAKTTFALYRRIDPEKQQLKNARKMAILERKARRKITLATRDTRVIERLRQKFLREYAKAEKQELKLLRHTALAERDETTRRARVQQRKEKRRLR